jgi:hypothetical protein
MLFSLRKNGSANDSEIKKEKQIGKLHEKKRMKRNSRVLQF